MNELARAALEIAKRSAKSRVDLRVREPWSCGWDEAIAAYDAALGGEQEAQIELQARHAFADDDDGPTDAAIWSELSEAERDRYRAKARAAYDATLGGEAEEPNDQQVERAYKQATQPTGIFNAAWGIVQGMEPDLRPRYEAAFRAQIRDLLVAALKEKS